MLCATDIVLSQENVDIETIQPLRCAPSDITYTHFGPIDDKTLILANTENNVILAALRRSCPRLLDDNRIMMLFQKGDGLSRIGSRMCADDQFMMIRSDVITVNNADSRRACEFLEFREIPVNEALELVKEQAIRFRGIGYF